MKTGYVATRMRFAGKDERVCGTMVKDSGSDDDRDDDDG